MTNLWPPATAHPPAALVREELLRIERSRAFRHSTQLRKFLRHLVERSLDGTGEGLKEMALGVEVFHRSPSVFDPRKDPIVRVEAARLREKLAAYYGEEGGRSLLEISIPVGSYVPGFARRSPASAGVLFPSLIVLPLANLTGDPAKDTFCDGLTDELIDGFARMPGLKVIARTTAFQFRGNQDVRHIGRQVGAETVLEGSVQQRGRRVKVIVQLVRTTDGSHLWSRVLAGESDDMFAMQATLTRGIVESLQQQFAAHPAADGWAPAQARLIRRGTSVAEARDLHDRARALLRRIRVDSQRRALELFGEAARLDPGFALAHSGLAAAWTNLASIGAERGARALPAARAAARRALDIDAELAEALSVRAYVAFRHDFDAGRAEEDYVNGLRLNPSATYLRLGYVWLLALTGRAAEAHAQFALVREIDPLDTGLRHNHALLLWHLRAFEQAAHAAEAAVEIEPEDVASRWAATIAHASLGNGAAALRHASEGLRLGKGLPVATIFHALAQVAQGDAAAARADVEALERSAGGEDLPAIHMALVWAQLGQADRAFGWLETALDARETHCVAIPVLPLLDPLRADPRWPALLAASRLPLMAG